MEIVDVDASRETFEILCGTERSQGGLIVLPPGERTGGPHNQHPDSDQWLYVRSGTGHAIVDGESVALEPGHLVVIGAGETHELVADPDTAIEFVTIYAPPAY